MLLNLFGTLRNTGVPCTLREFLDLLAGLEKQLAFANSEDFYYLSRATLVKERNTTISLIEHLIYISRV